MFDDYDFTGFWLDNDYARNEYIEAAPSDELIAEVEEELGYKLPASYVWLMKQHNGGIPTKSVFPASVMPDGARGDIWISDIMGIGRTKTWSLCGELGSRHKIEEWGYPDIGVAVCNCPSAGHDMVFLDYRECGAAGEPKVVHIDQESDYAITPVADSFEEFIMGLVAEEPICAPEPKQPVVNKANRWFRKRK